MADGSRLARMKITNVGCIEPEGLTVIAEFVHLIPRKGKAGHVVSHSDKDKLRNTIVELGTNGTARSSVRKIVDELISTIASQAVFDGGQ